MSRQRRIDSDPLVQEAARRMRLKADSGLEAAICGRAEELVATWMSQYGINPERLDDVHETVKNHTGLHIVRVETDEDLRAAATKIDGKVVPVQLEMEFAGNTEALVYRASPEKRSATRYIALIDARGARAYKAWHAERHEGAHVIVPDPNGGMVMRRTKEERPEPFEQVMDAVAARVGFWRPLVEPAVRACLTAEKHLLDAFELARSCLAPTASKEACYRAFVNYVDQPTLIIWCAMGCRASERGGSPPASMALRAQTIIANNAAALAGLQVWRNYRVPESSVISAAYASDHASWIVGRENLRAWTSETGRGLGDLTVSVAARGQWAVIQANA